ncbi:MAG: DUF4167 domain-containing protein [Paracoccaceae bacterium]
MRSSKSRSRSKQNRPRTLGNIVNRVFDSSGPEGKVRGTPQQIIEKYQILARDAQLSNDRVAAENFLQHAEHYTRMLGEAQREMQAEQEARQQNWQQNGGNGQNGGQQNGGNGGQQNGNGNGHPQQRDRDNSRERDRDGRENREQRADFRADRNEQPRTEFRAPDPRHEEPPVPAGVEVIDLTGDEDAGLVETPEAREPVPVAAPEAGTADRPARAPRTQQPRRQPKPAPEAAAQAPASAEAADEPGKGPRRPRGPRKPKAEAAPQEGGDPREAAE